MQSEILKNRSRVHRHSRGVQLILFYVDYYFIERKLSFDFGLVIRLFCIFFLSRISRKSTLTELSLLSCDPGNFAPANI